MTDLPTKPIRNSVAEFLIPTGQAGKQSIEARYEVEPLLSAVTKWRRK